MRIISQVRNTFTTVMNTIFPYNFVFYEKSKPIVLGRWHINHSDDKKTIKADYSNLDHCGPCGFDELRDVHNNDKTNTKTNTKVKKA